MPGCIDEREVVDIAERAWLRLAEGEAAWLAAQLNVIIAELGGLLESCEGQGALEGQDSGRALLCAEEVGCDELR